MRRIVMFNRVTADGYFAAPDGNLDWVVPEEVVDKAAASTLPESDAMLLGRRTYEIFESFWPKAVDDSATSPDPHNPAKRSPEIHTIGVWINEATKLVVSKNRKDVTWKNSRLLRTLDPAEIEAIKKQPGGQIMIFGSGSVVSQLTTHRLIDEYQILVSPVLIGKGQLLFRDLPAHVKLKLLEAKSYPSGNVMLRYAPA